MNIFKEMGLPEALIHKLEHMQFSSPTPIQSKAIPVALQGDDIIGSAQTGTGKTGAFAIPLIAKILTNKCKLGLVITPTRELAKQVNTQLETMLGRKSKIKSTLLIGGESITRQLIQLKKKPNIIVGTPGRINDHLRNNKSMLNDVDFLVLDETDRMLDMGFSIQIDEILEHVTPNRQTLLFSATLPSNIIKITKKYMNNPVRIAVNTDYKPAVNIKQDILKVDESEKYQHLLSELDNREGSIIIFMKTKSATEKMASKLTKEGHSADAIHGDLRQSKRDRVINAFRKQKYRILVATDVAARGLDIPHIEHVINYDLPQCPEDYIHRIGRTARAGAKGLALNLISNADKSKWRRIEILMNPDMKSKSSSSSTGRQRSSGKRNHNPKNKGRSFSKFGINSSSKNGGKNAGRGKNFNRNKKQA